MPSPIPPRLPHSPKMFFAMKKTGMQVSADKRQSRASAAIAEALLIDAKYLENPRQQIRKTGDSHAVGQVLANSGIAEALALR